MNIWNKIGQQNLLIVMFLICRTTFWSEQQFISNTVNNLKSLQEYIYK